MVIDIRGLLHRRNIQGGRGEAAAGPLLFSFWSGIVPQLITHCSPQLNGKEKFHPKRQMLFISNFGEKNSVEGTNRRGN